MMDIREPLKIAILGSTSHIAKGLIYHFWHLTEHRLHLFARSAAAVHGFLQAIKAPPGSRCLIYEGYDGFLEGDYDVVINCVGVGTQKKLRGNYSLYFTVIEDFDNLALQYLRRQRLDSLYISLSSGAVYGRHHRKPVNEKSSNTLQVNKIRPEDYYGIARIYAEAKHRSFGNLNIVDVRVFSYFSRFADIGDEYFMAEILRAVVNNTPFRTTPEDMVRDYIHPLDLFRLIQRCIEIRRLNTAFDAVSLKPVSKMEILHLFSTEWNLRCEFMNGPPAGSATGIKTVYCSDNRSATRIGHQPLFTSLETLREESRRFLQSLETGVTVSPFERR